MAGSLGSYQTRPPITPTNHHSFMQRLIHLLLIFISILIPAGPICPRSLNLWVNAQTSPIIPGDPSTPPFQPQTDPELADTTLSTFKVLSPAALSGIFIGVMSPEAGPMWVVSPEAAAAGEYNLTFPIILPNSAEDDNRYGCSPMTHSVNDEGDWLNRSIVLIERRGGCTFSPKLLNCEGIGAGAMLIHNCPPPCEQGLFRITGEPASASTVPAFFMGYSDGYLLRDYLVGRRNYLNATRQGLPDPTPGTDYTQPLVVEVVGTGPLVPDELLALQAIAQEITLDPSSFSSNTALRDWSSLLDPVPLDPCLHRITTLLCERGHVTSIWLKYYGLTGTISSAIGSLPYLRDLTLAENYVGSGLTGIVPSEVCQLPLLRSLVISTNSLTSLPSCLGNGTRLVYLEASNTPIVALPDMLHLSRDYFVYLKAVTTSITTLPIFSLNQLHLTIKWDLSFNSLQSEPNFAALSLVDFTQLQTILFQGCQLTGVISSTFIVNAPQLSSLSLQNNAFIAPFPTGDLFSVRNIPKISSLLLGSAGNFNTTVLPATLFDGQTLLTTLDISRNSFAPGPLPTLSGCTSLTSVIGSHNSFVGGLPSTWNTLSACTNVDFSFNSLTGPLDAASSMNALLTLRLDHNQIYVPGDNDVGEFLQFKIGYPLLQALYIQDNMINGSWNEGAPPKPPLHTLNCSNNLINYIPTDFFNFGQSSLVVVDLSFNLINGPLPDYINNILITLNVQGNPFLTLPSWVVPDSSGVFSSIPSALFECTGTASTQFPGLSLNVDQVATHYSGCRCKNGAYGQSPHCLPVPSTPITIDIPVNDTITYITRSNRHSSLSSKELFSITPPWDRPPPPFSDSLYLPQALGLVTSWEVNLAAFRLDTRSGTIQEMSGSDVLVSTRISTSDSLQPIRAITLHVFLSSQFVLSNSTITVRDGAQNLVFEISSANTTTIAVPATSSPYWTEVNSIPIYASQLAQLTTPISLVEVTVFSNLAFLSFATSEAHNTQFVTTFTANWSCPDGLILYDTDTSTQCLTRVTDAYLPGRTYTYECLALQSGQAVSSGVDATSPLQTLRDPASVDYVGCRCAVGTFGTPPYCSQVPVNFIVQPYSQPSSPSLVFNMSDILGTAELDLSSNMTSVSMNSYGNHLPPMISDDWFGSRRVTLGVSTRWDIDLRNLRRAVLDDSSGDGLNDTDITVNEFVANNFIGGDDPLQPVRSLTIRLHISKTNFIGASNSIVLAETVQSSPDTVSYVLLQTISPTDLTSTCVNSSPFTEDSTYQIRYAKQLQALGPQTDTCLFEITTQHSAASVTYNSRDVDGRHFLISYSYEFLCTPPLSLDSSNLCSTNTTSQPIITVILIVSGILLLVLIVWLLRERYERIRASQSQLELIVQSGAVGSGGDENSREALKRQYEALEAQVKIKRTQELRQELALDLVVFATEILFLISNWVDVGAIARDSSNDPDSFHNSRLSLTFLAIVVISTITFFLNSVLRVGGIIHVWNLLNNVTMVRETAIHKLSGIQRQLLRLQALTAAVLFDSLPVASLHLARLVSGSGGTNNTNELRSLVIGVFLLGYKFSVLIQIAHLKHKELVIQKEIAEDKFLSTRSEASRRNLMSKSIDQSGGSRRPTTAAEALAIGVNHDSHPGMSRAHTLSHRNQAAISIQEEMNWTPPDPKEVPVISPFCLVDTPASAAGDPSTTHSNGEPQLTPNPLVSAAHERPPQTGGSETEMVMIGTDATRSDDC